MKSAAQHLHLWKQMHIKNVHWLSRLVCGVLSTAFSHCKFMPQLYEVDLNLMKQSDSFLYPRLYKLDRKVSLFMYMTGDYINKAESKIQR